MIHHTKVVIFPLGFSILTGVFLVGCGGPASSPARPSSSAVTAPTKPPAIPDMSEALSEGKISSQNGNQAVDESQQGMKANASPADASQTSDPSSGHGQGDADAESPAVAAAPVPEEERQVAVAGVGRKGKDYGGGIISEPVSQYFGMRERIAFIAVQRAMRTFEAEHERAPDSHEEFMTEIINENGIQLPALYADERYEYDPEYGELMVVRPKK